jgi:hypothetical protein
MLVTDRDNRAFVLHGELVVARRTRANVTVGGLTKAAARALWSTSFPGSPAIAHSTRVMAELGMIFAPARHWSPPALDDMLAT